MFKTLTHYKKDETVLSWSNLAEEAQMFWVILMLIFLYFCDIQWKENNSTLSVSVKMCIFCWVFWHPVLNLCWNILSFSASDVSQLFLLLEYGQQNPHLVSGYPVYRFLQCCWIFLQAYFGLKSPVETQKDETLETFFCQSRALNVCYLLPRDGDITILPKEMEARMSTHRKPSLRLHFSVWLKDQHILQI